MISVRQVGVGALGWMAVVGLGLGAVLPVFIMSFRVVMDGLNVFAASGDAALSVRTALINSTMCASLAAFSGVVVGWVILLSANNSGVVFLILVTLFFPGTISGLGFSYALHYLIDSAYFVYWSACALILSMVGYIIPYQLVAGLWFLDAIPMEERRSSNELFGTLWMKARYWCRKLLLPSLMIFLVGFSLALTEVPRSQYLGVDFVGAGRQYFGPWFSQRFNSVGLVAGVFPLFSIICVCLALVFYLVRPRVLKE